MSKNMLTLRNLSKNITFKGPNTVKLLHTLFVMVIVTMAACGGNDSDSTKSLTTALLITDKFGQQADSFVVGVDGFQSVQYNDLIQLL